MLSACLYIAYMIENHTIACRDVLCTDKTGTLTMDEVHLFKALDTAGKESMEILRLAYANSTFQASPLPRLITGMFCQAAQLSTRAVTA